MTVPEAPVNKNDFVLGWEHEVGAAWQVFSV
jgi:hypothetical protein